MECDFAPDAPEPRVDFGAEGGIDTVSGIVCRNPDCGHDCSNLSSAWDAVEAAEKLWGEK